MSSAATSHDLGDCLLDAVAGPSLPSHFYFHVPFCRSKCAYCDFASEAGTPAPMVDAVFGAMRAQVERWKRTALPGVVETVYVGGGTPSLHYERVGSLLRAVKTGLPVCEGAEVTVEANPESLTLPALELLEDAGTNRLSVGVQSFDDASLHLLGRCHTGEQAWQACRSVAERGMELSLDLICGIPGKSDTRREAWVNTLTKAIETGAKHMSIYPLQLEPGTALAIAAEEGLLELPSEDEVADALESACECLSDSGLMRYEVASYAVPGHESRHNTAYWTGRQYAGVGPAAHGMLDPRTARAVGVLSPSDDSGAARVRYQEPASIDQWLCDPLGAIELLDQQESEREDAMLGLRLVAGIEESLAKRAGVLPALSALEDEGLVCKRGARWATTERGWLLGNEVFERVWCGDD